MYYMHVITTAAVTKSRCDHPLSWWIVSFLAYDYPIYQIVTGSFASILFIHWGSVLIGQTHTSAIVSKVFGERCNLNWHSRTRTTYYSTWMTFVNILRMWVSTCFVDSIGDRPGVTNRWSWVVSWHSWFCGWIDSTCIAAAGWGVHGGRMTIVKVAADAGWSSSVCRPTFNSMNHYLRRFGYSCATT
jgi:hypothetical protein